MESRDFAVAALVAQLAVACGPAAAVRAEPHTKAAPTQRAPDGSELDFSASAASKPGRMHEDPWWQRARDHDPIFIAQLADHEGAAGLLEGVVLGGPIGALALAALPHAPDAEVALGPVCELTERTHGPALTLVLGALLAIAERVPADVERVGAEAITQCETTLASLVTSRHAQAPQRDLADAARVQLQRLPR